MGIFLEDNVAQGIRTSQSTPYKIGVSDLDNGGIAPEAGLTIPYTIDPEFTFLAYNTWIECYADSGIVTHRPLPQGTYPFDHLGNEDLYLASGLDKVRGTGPNIASRGNWTDIVQRMANTRFWFCLKGFAYRVACQPVFPFLKSICGQPAIPDDAIPQKTIGPIVVGNNSGVNVYYAAWASWYTIAKSPPVSGKLIVPPPNYAERTNTSPATLPKGIQIPLTMPDQNSVKSAPGQTSRSGPGSK